MRKSASVLLSLFALCLVGAGIYYFVNGALDVVGKISPNVGAAIVAGLATAAVALLNQRTSRLREIAESHRPQKVEIYNIFMDIVDMMMDLSKRGQLSQITDNSMPDGIEDLMKKFRRGLVVWASPEVIRSWENLRIADNQNIELLRRADGVFRAIRKDLGNSNWGLAQGALIKLFLKDPNEYDRLLGRRSN